jgi:hypothetical protein
MEVQSLLSQEYPMERVKLRHKQTSNVLRTDSLEQLDEDLKGVAKALNPESRIVQILSDDFARSSWEARRYQRALSTIVRMAQAEALYDMLTRQLNAREPKEARGVVEMWALGLRSPQSSKVTDLRSKTSRVRRCVAVCRICSD